jgi:hypothetical protein
MFTDVILGKKLSILLLIIPLLASPAALSQETETMPNEVIQAVVRYTITNGGADVGGKGTYTIYPVGKHDKEIGHADSGYEAHLAPGTYDVRLYYRDGSVKKEQWLLKQDLQLNVDQSVEMNVTPAELVVHVKRLGQPSQTAGCAIYAPGLRSDPVTRFNPEETVRVAEGNYDVGCVYNDQGLTVEQWLTNQAVKEKTEMSFAFDFQRASFKVVDPPSAPPPVSSLVQMFPAGVRDKVVARGVVGTPLVFPAGTYDIVIQRDQKAVTWTNISIEGDVSVPMTDAPPAAVLKNVSIAPESLPAIPESRPAIPETTHTVPLPPPLPVGPLGLPAPPNLTNVPAAPINWHGWFGCSLLKDE